MRKRPAVARSLAPGVAGVTLMLLASICAPAAAQTPSIGPGDAVLPAGGVIPGSGAGLVLGIVGSADGDAWGRLVRGSIEAEAATAAATVIDCGGAGPSAAGGCLVGDPGRPPDVMVDLRVAAQDEGGCPSPPTALIVIDRRDAPCHATTIGVDMGAAGRLLGQVVGDALRTGDRCAADRLLVLAPSGVVGGTADAVAGMRAGFRAACGSLADDAVVEIAATPDAIGASVVAALDGLAPDAPLVILGANDASAIEALAAVRSLDRPGAVAMGAIGGLQPAWGRIACDPAWVADVALFPERYGRSVVPVAIAIAEGEDVAPSLATPMQILDSSSIRSIYPDVPAC